MTHLKSYGAPTSWNIRRKESTFTTRPNPGAHPFERGLPINTLLKQLGVTKNTRETKRIINDKAIEVDGATVKDIHTNTGFMDTIHIKPDITIRCRLDTKGRLAFNNIPKAELNKKVCQITNKQTIKGGKVQLSLSGGRTILADNKYKTGDSLLIEVPGQKIIDHFPLAKGNAVFLIGGRHIGTKGTITDIQGDRIWLNTDKGTIETLKEYTYVIGKDKPAITI